MRTFEVTLSGLYESASENTERNYAQMLTETPWDQHIRWLWDKRENTKTDVSASSDRYRDSEVERKKRKEELDVYTIPTADEEELSEIFRRIGDNEAFGLNAVANRTPKFAIKTGSDWVSSVFEARIVEEVFPAR